MEPFEPKYRIIAKDAHNLILQRAVFDEETGEVMRWKDEGYYGPNNMRGLARRMIVIALQGGEPIEGVDQWVKALDEATARVQVMLDPVAAA